MLAAAKYLGTGAVILTLDISRIITGGATLVVVGGLLALGAVRALASAWKGERDAAVSKAHRLEHQVVDQKAELSTLRSEVESLRQQTNVALYAERQSHEHKAITTALNDLVQSSRANTTALEFLARQLQLNLDLEGGTTP